MHTRDNTKAPRKTAGYSTMPTLVDMNWRQWLGLPATTPTPEATHLPPQVQPLKGAVTEAPGTMQSPNTHVLVWRMRYTYWDWQQIILDNQDPGIYHQALINRYPEVMHLVEESGNSLEWHSDWLLNENMLEVTATLRCSEQIQTWAILKYGG